MHSLTLKRHNPFQNQNNRKATHTLASSWNKNLENPSFENVSFSR